MKEIFEGFKFDDDYIHKLRVGDETTERHFVSYFGALLQIKIRRHLACVDHVEDIQRETLAGALAAIRSGSDVPHPERLGAVVNGVCNKLLRDFHGSPMRSKPVDDSPIDRQERAMDAESTAWQSHNQKPKPTTETRRHGEELRKFAQKTKKFEISNTEEEVVIRGLVQQVLYRLPSGDRQVLRTAVEKDRYNRRDEIAENPGASKDYLRNLLFRAKQQWAADRGMGSRVRAD